MESNQHHPCQPKPATLHFLARIWAYALLSLPDPTLPDSQDQFLPSSNLSPLPCPQPALRKKPSNEAGVHISAYLGCAPSPSPPSSAWGSEHAARAAKPFRPFFFFLNKQEDHKVCLHDRPAKHKTPAVPWLRTWQLQQAGANIHSGIAPWGREPGVCTATVLSAVGLAGAQGGEGGLISLPCASRLHLGDNHNGAGCEGAFSRFPNFPLPISHQGNPCGYSLSPWDLGHDLPLH